jgi:transglutaminase-like putative cysteine protease
MNSLRYLAADLPDDIKNLVTIGNFDEANKLIDIYMDRNISTMLKERLNFEKHRMKVLKRQYTYSYDKALELMQEKIDNFSQEELYKLKAQRYIDWIFIDGKPMFHRSFFENILKVNKDIKNRLKNKDDENPSTILNDTVNEIISNGEKKYFIHLRTGIELMEEGTKIGEKIRVHIPIPQNAIQIKNIKILNTSHEIKYISPEDHPQRTIYFEGEVKGGDKFTVEYSYENHIKYNELDFDKVSRLQPKFHTEEWPPHIVFTPFLVDLANEIVGCETNPLKKARKIYDYITKNVQYSYVRPYQAILNIAEYCAYNLKGDCGVQALLFITLCRIAGIPARWQSGLYVNPEYIGCHDWANIYVEPYGWLFADPSFGGGAYRNKNEKRWNFYFGNLDPFRMVANSEFQYDLLPEKKFLRSDPYDNQVGEVEYFDKAIQDGEGFEPIMEIVDVHEI